MEIDQDEGIESEVTDQKFELWINLKMEIDGKIENQNKTERVCEICGKVFASGKALGGHMRIHFPENNRKAGDQKPQVIGEPICLMCGKGFPSMKSLYGHMRCHPDRAWRGIRPPTPPSCVDLTESLLRWPVTDRRGRKAIAVGSSSEKDQILDAVNQLMMLSKGDASERQIQDEFSEFETEIVGNNNAVSGSETELMIDDEEIGINVVGDYGGRETENNSLKVIVKKKIMKRRKKKKLSDLNKYRCSTCDRSFPTHQALGGHCSSHNKFINSAILTTTKTSDDDRKMSRSSDTSQKVMDIDLNEAPASEEDDAGFGTD